jgi:hypothetical protein
MMHLGASPNEVCAIDLSGNLDGEQSKREHSETAKAAMHHHCGLVLVVVLSEAGACLF